MEKPDAPELPDTVAKIDSFVTLPDWFIAFAEQHPWAYSASATLALLVVVWISNFITKQVLMRGVRKLLSRTELGADPNIGIAVIIRRISHVVPALVLSAGIHLIPEITETITIVVSNVCVAYIILTLARAFHAAMHSVNEIYNKQRESHERPIKGYLQIVSIIIYAIAAILIIAALIDKSPVILLSGIGAMGAVLMLIFQDTLLSLVASVQVSSNDMVRVGDWIEMPQMNADGDVIDMALHTITVQNWDRTISTIPTKRLLSESFKNWRGMTESGGRRMKRSLLIDQNSIGFLSDEKKQELSRFSLLKDYIEDKEKELSQWNQELEANGYDPVNSRQVTNIGTFRAYVLRYLQNNDNIQQDATMMVRQLEPSPHGLPIEIYCFVNTTAWAKYEGIQSDIFDHLLAILPEFGLQLFQEPSGPDVRMALERIIETTTETKAKPRQDSEDSLKRVTDGDAEDDADKEAASSKDDAQQGTKKSSD